jgi:hypothetical protein
VLKTDGGGKQPPMVGLQVRVDPEVRHRVVQLRKRSAAFNNAETLRIIFETGLRVCESKGLVKTALENERQTGAEDLGPREESRRRGE